MSSSLVSRAAAAALALLLSACASGPSDFADLRQPPSSPEAQAVRDEAGRANLERDLAAQADRLAANGRAADAGLPSAMALAIIRQQQAEEARKLLEGVDAEAAAGGKPDALCPATDPACPPSASAQ